MMLTTFIVCTVAIYLGVGQYVLKNTVASLK